MIATGKLVSWAVVIVTVTCLDSPAQRNTSSLYPPRLLYEEIVPHTPDSLQPFVTHKSVAPKSSSKSEPIDLDVGKCEGGGGSYGDIVEQAWVSHYASGLATSSDQATAMAVDRFGNVYVTGSSPATWTGPDYLTIKYDSSGFEQWEARYSGPGGLADYPTAIVVDTSGNVYVTGYSRLDTDSVFYCYATVKYNSTGAEEWVALYNGRVRLRDNAPSIAVDRSGNVYVAGETQVEGDTSDYATIKYTPAGSEEWVARYNGPADGPDIPTGIAIDLSGSIYVTGYNSSYDLATIKYSPAGVQEWVDRYSRSGSFLRCAAAIVVGPAGDILVMARSEGSGMVDYHTVKYSPAGVLEWAACYSGSGHSPDYPFAFTCDDSGNTYVTGASRQDSSYDYATVKYDTAANEKWVARYDGPEKGNDFPKSIALDSAGNVFVTGESAPRSANPGWPSPSSEYATVKYNKYGMQQMVGRFSGPKGGKGIPTAIRVLPCGESYVTGYCTGPESDESDYVTIKYSATGDEAWVANFNSPGNSIDHASAIAIDPSGNAYVTGWSQLGENRNFSTIKYDVSGSVKWIEYWYPGSGNASARAIAVDRYGDVYVTGSSNGFATICYAPEWGMREWTSRYVTAIGPNTIAEAIALDAAGNVFVTGSSMASWSYSDFLYDYATVMYNAQGEEQWTHRYRSPVNGDSRPHAMATDGKGNVYVTGESLGLDGGYDFVTVKYNSAGAEVWVVRYNGPNDGSRASLDVANDIAVDQAGYIYVTGGSQKGYATVKYDSLGAERWVARYQAPRITSARAQSVAVDSEGNIFVTGFCQDSTNSGRYYATAKYNAEGQEEWVALYRGPENSSNTATAIALDGQGNAYVSGTSKRGKKGDFATIKYNNAGDAEWIMSYDGPDGANDEVSGMSVDQSGNVYVTGTSSNSTWSVSTTIKYMETTVDARKEPDVPAEFSLSQNYPNPFNPTTTIRYGLRRRSHVLLAVYNTLGQKVAELVNGDMDAGSREVQFDGRNLASGVYFYRLQAGDFVQTRKLILVR